MCVCLVLWYHPFLFGGFDIFMHEQSTNHISLKNRPRCYTKSPTEQVMFWPIPGLIRCTGVTGRYLMHRMQSGGWPYSQNGRESSKVPSLHAAVFHAAVFRLKIICT